VVQPRGGSPGGPDTGWRWDEAGGVGFWRAAALEAVLPCCAAVSSRLGGVSAPPFGSLNLGRVPGDDPRAVGENRARLASALGLAPGPCLAPRQVHGDRVVAVQGGSPHPGEADGLATTSPGLALVILVADCVPVFVADPRLRAAALVHAGWRGTAAGIARRAVETLAEAFGSEPSDLWAAVGPSIGPCCYEVDGPVMARFDPEVLQPGRPGHAHLDLWEANRRQLVAAGLRGDRIAVAALCTACHTDRLFSHRAERGRTGRLAAVLQVR
jgi:YfiH family protein